MTPTTLLTQPCPVAGCTFLAVARTTSAIVQAIADHCNAANTRHATHDTERTRRDT
jgi:hypothetical protein